MPRSNAKLKKVYIEDNFNNLHDFARAFMRSHYSEDIQAFEASLTEINIKIDTSIEIGSKDWISKRYPPSVFVILMNNAHFLTRNEKDFKQKAALKEFVTKLTQSMEAHGKTVTEKQKNAIQFLLKTFDEIKSGDKTFLFNNFDPATVIAQMVARILMPETIQQRREQVCGIVTLMQNFADGDPEVFARYVMDIATKGEAVLRYRDDVKGIKVILNKKLLEQASVFELQNKNPETNHIKEADFISLVVFRDSENKMVSYKGGSSAFGVTFGFEMHKWMHAAGYSNVQKVKTDESGIKQLEQLFKDGYQAAFATTGDLTEIIQEIANKTYKGNPDIPNKIALLLHGHFIRLSNMALIEDNHVKLSIISWGEESIDIKVPYDIFTKLQGDGEVYVGQTWEARVKFRRDGQLNDTKLEKEHKKDPSRYCLEVRDTILSEEWPQTEDNFILKYFSTSGKSLSNSIPAKLKSIIKIINDAKTHAKGITWEQSAEKLAKAIQALPENDTFKMFKREWSYKLNNVGAVAYENSKKADNTDTKKIHLDHAIEHRHFPALQAMIALQLEANERETAVHYYNKHKAWLTTHERDQLSVLFKSHNLEIEQTQLTSKTSLSSHSAFSWGKVGLAALVTGLIVGTAFLLIITLGGAAVTTPLFSFAGGLLVELGINTVGLLATAGFFVGTIVGAVATFITSAIIFAFKKAFSRTKNPERSDKNIQELELKRVSAEEYHERGLGRLTELKQKAPDDGQSIQLQGPVTPDQSDDESEDFLSINDSRLLFTTPSKGTTLQSGQLNTPKAVPTNTTEESDENRSEEDDTTPPSIR